MRVSTAAAKSDYILREGRYAGDADEVVVAEHGHMPAWAEQNPRDYWEAADLYERSNGRLFVEVEVALPREFGQAQRIAAMRDLADKVTGAEQLPYMWVIHRGLDAEGNDHNPHGHLVVSERGLDGYDRTPETWFKRYNGEAGGARKTKALQPKKWLTDLRAEWASILNWRLKYDDRVDHRSYIEQGVMRLPQPHLGPCSWNAMQSGRTTPRTERFEHMQTLNRDLIGWAEDMEPMPEHMVDESRFALEAIAEDDLVEPRWTCLIDYHRAAVEYLKRTWTLVWDRKYGMFSGETDDELRETEADRAWEHELDSGDDMLGRESQLDHQAIEPKPDPTAAGSFDEEWKPQEEPDQLPAPKDRPQYRYQDRPPPGGRAW